MSQRNVKILVLALIALVLMSCNISTPNVLNRQTVNGSGSVKTEERAVSGFSKVSLEGAGKVNLMQGSEEKLTIEAEENLLPYITTEVTGSELRIGFKDGYNIVPHKEIRYNLTLKDLSSLSVSGAHDVSADALKASDLTLSVSGAGKIDIKGLDVKSLHINSSGAGTFTLAGVTDRQDILISGAGNYYAADLKSNSANITVSGAGSSSLWATEDLTVQINGLGKVEYYGSPSVNKQISGAGSVESKGDK